MVAEDVNSKGSLVLVLQSDGITKFEVMQSLQHSHFGHVPVFWQQPLEVRGKAQAEQFVGV